MTILKKMPTLLFGLMLVPRAFAQEVSADEAVALMEECQRQRQENIAPLREEAIETCMTERGDDRETCERRNRNYGERTHGGRQAGLFWDLPACEKAVAAERYFRMNPGQKTFTYEGS